MSKSTTLLVGVCTIIQMALAIYLVPSDPVAAWLLRLPMAIGLFVVGPVIVAFVALVFAGFDLLVLTAIDTLYSTARKP